MRLTRRDAVKKLAACASAASLARGFAAPTIRPGPFQPTRESLKNFQAPEWFRDAKFGIWAHWGPQSAPEYGDWYARNMYIQGHRQYKYHTQKYGHPSKFGFKDIIPTWKAEKFDPGYLMGLYKKAGAKYFVSMGVHHDNFDLWDSKLNQWNAVKMGPKKDIVGLFQKAALKEGLRFGVSEHLAVSYHWFQTSHGSDATGEFKGVPYDGSDRKYTSLYHETHQWTSDDPWSEAGVPEKWKEHYFLRIKDLLDRYQPDYMYTDGPIFFGDWGLALMAHHYNRIAKKDGGKSDTVWATKGKSDCINGTCVLDLERGVVDSIWEEPWQTDTCIGSWHYDKEVKYKSPKIVIDMLVDIVSRNGNLLLNFPLPSSGMLDPEELKVLAEITKWMAVNSEAIHGTRPWKTFGEGSAARAAAQHQNSSEYQQAAAFNERSRKPLTSEEIRFTKKGDVLYAFCMGWPGTQAKIAALALGGQHDAGKIRNVELLGFNGKLNWNQDASGLAVQMPADKPSDHAVVLKVIGV